MSENILVVPNATLISTDPELVWNPESPDLTQTASLQLLLGIQWWKLFASSMWLFNHRNNVFEEILALLKSIGSRRAIVLGVRRCNIFGAVMEFQRGLWSDQFFCPTWIMFSGETAWYDSCKGRMWGRQETPRPTERKKDSFVWRVDASAPKIHTHAHDSERQREKKREIDRFRSESLNPLCVCLSLGLFTHLSVYLAVCTSVWLSVCLSVFPLVFPSISPICLSICMLVCPPICLSVFSSAYLSVHLPISLSVYPSVCPSHHPFVCPCVSDNPSVFPSIYLSTHWSINPCLSTCASLSTHLPVCSSVCLSTYLSSCQPICQSVCMIVCLSAHPSIDLSVYSA